MIPRLEEREHTDGRLDAVYRSFFEALAGAGFSGEIARDRATRTVAATDNSIYQLVPRAVVFPRSTQDVRILVSLAAEERFRSVRYSPRGGGTGTNGQSLVDGVVVDLSRHMNRILEVDPLGRWVRVEPGVVLDQLNDRLRPSGVFFAPTLSTSSRATLGGMISTDACGKGSRVYGRTSDHLLALKVVLTDGSLMISKPLSEAELEEVKASGDRAAQVHREVDRIVTDDADLIRESFPPLRRFLTGYNLAKVRGGERGDFDLNYLLAGSEGTLGVVCEATLKLTPIPRHRALVVLKYASFAAALNASRVVVESDPSAIETIDERILSLAREDIIYHEVGDLIADEPAGPTRAINLVEYQSDDEALVRARVADLVGAVEARRGADGEALGYHVARTPREAASLWELRKKGVGLLAASPGARKPVAFVEDTVVPPERLPEYVAAFRRLLDEAGLEYGMFGHIDVGCLHVRPALDLKDPRDEDLVRLISDRVADLVREYGGLMWGEHGRGYRSEYGPDFFGEALYGDCRKIKEIFDPHNQLNPGKLATPLGSEESVVSVDAEKRGAFDRQIPAMVRDHFAVALGCNGNGACFHYDADYVMCPSSKVTRDRVHSPKGRASLLREWLRQLAGAGHDPMGELAATPRWRPAPVAWLRRLGHTIGRARGRYDFSNEVFASVNGCLSCKACATQCPVKVDVPQLKSEFLHLYYGRYLRPIRDLLLASLESMVGPLSRLARLTNLLIASRFPGRPLMRIFGLADVPRLSIGGVRRGLAERGAAPPSRAELQALSEAERRRSVLLLQDAFTSFYESDIVLATYDLLEALGFRVRVVPFSPNGKGLHVKGFLNRFRRVAAANAARLAELAVPGVAMIGIDPAVVLTYRDEYPHTLGADALPFRVQLLQEWLAAVELPEPGPAPTGEPFVLLGHCTERTAVPGSVEAWQPIFARFGLELETPEVGCCGMCGIFGHESAHLEESRGIYTMSWQRHAEGDAAKAGRVLATGHSCRHQAGRFGGVELRHPVQALLERIRDDGIKEETSGE